MANRVLLERPTARREREFLAAVARSRTLHGTYVAPPSTPAEYRLYLRRLSGPSQESFFVLAPEDGSLAGVININDIVRGSFQSGSLGYYAFTPHAGRGLMGDALRLVVGAAFKEFGLHRLEANIQPGNARSIALVTALGFRLEGFSPRFLKLSGRWRDHLRWAILADEWRPGVRRAHSPARPDTAAAGAESRAPRSTSRAPRTESRAPHRESRAPRSESRGPRSESRAARAFARRSS